MKTTQTKTKVLTANRLTDGIAVWLGASGEWTASLRDAFLARHEDAVAAIETEDQFKPLRLMNGLYLQLHAYMLRVAIPYGTLNSRQMTALGDIADKYDRGYGHFTTRQNIQYNWIKLEDAMPTSSPTSPRSRCTRSRPAATASATPRRTLRRRAHDEVSIRAPMPN
jgi:hypothetical protein